MIGVMGRFCFLLVGFFLSSCSSLEPAYDNSYQMAAQQSQALLAKWRIEGRLAVVSKDESWSASLIWDHELGNEQLSLSGPLGQSAVHLQLQNGWVILDRGNGTVERSNQPEQFLGKRLGLAVPMTALCYWLLGVPAPGQLYVIVSHGFKQAEWSVEYKQMQQVKEFLLPKRLSVTNGYVKLKLIIDQWGI